MGQFTTAENAVEPGTPHIYPAVASTRNRSFVNLVDEEKRGGHAISRHVNRTDASLLAEAVIPDQQNFLETRYKAIGSFMSLSDANNFVNRVLESNTEAVDAVATGVKDDAWLETRFG